MAQATNCTVCVYGGIPLDCKYHKTGIPADVLCEIVKCPYFQRRPQERCDDDLPCLEENGKCSQKILRK